MSRINHIKHQPMNTEYWDYYILCHLDADVAITLQRMEFWDGTKDDGNTHAEDINDALIKSGQTPTQDTSHWIYKAQDELCWEIMGVAGEKRLAKIVHILVDQLHYLAQRNNPFEGWDRKKQYEFQATVLQEHIDYLSYIVGYFNLPLKLLRPVFCAIEALTRDKIYIDTLSVEKVIEKIEDFKEDPKTPHFLKEAIEKFDKCFLRPHVRSFRTLTEWKAQKCGMHSADMPNASRESAECNPQKCGSNSIVDYIGNNISNSHKEESIPDASQNATISPNGDSLSQDLVNALLKEIADLKAQVADLSTKAQQLPTSSTQANTAVDGGNLPHQGNVQTVEMKQDEASSHIANVTTQSELPGTPAPSKENGKKAETPKEAKPRQPLTEPDESMPWGVEKAMAWANYFRKFAYPVKNHANSKHRKALEAAEIIIQRDIPEKKFVYVFRYMKGGLLPNNLQSDYWSTKEVDIWTVNDHYENQKDEINRKRAERQQASSKNNAQSLAEALNPDRTFDNGLKYFPNVFVPTALVAAGSK